MRSRWKVVLILLYNFTEVQPQTNPDCEACINIFSTPGADDGALVGSYRYVTVLDLRHFFHISTLLSITILQFHRTYKFTGNGFNGISLRFIL